MSSVAAVGSAPYVPITNQVKKPEVAQQPATPVVQPVAKDADSDNDGSKGGQFDAYA